MDEEIALGEVSEVAAQKLNLRQYFWLYLIVVPLAAVSGSTVVVLVTALTEISSAGDMRPLFAKIILICCKIILGLGGAYIFSLIGSFGTVALMRSMRSELRKAVARAYVWCRKLNVKPRKFKFIKAIGNPSLNNSLVFTSVFYAGIIMFIYINKYVLDDFIAVWEFVHNLSENM